MPLLSTGRATPEKALQRISKVREKEITWNFKCISSFSEKNLIVCNSKFLENFRSFLSNANLCTFT